MQTQHKQEVKVVLDTLVEELVVEQVVQTHLTLQGDGLAAEEAQVPLHTLVGQLLPAGDLVVTVAQIMPGVVAQGAVEVIQVVVIKALQVLQVELVKQLHSLVDMAEMEVQDQ
jgi:hypothetical protein